MMKEEKDGHRRTTALPEMVMKTLSAISVKVRDSLVSIVHQLPR